MVNLAKELKDKDFHLVASYCQRGQKEATLEFLKSKGWDKDMKNFSVVYQAFHPAMEGRYIPYYLIFDKSGKLRHHHMAGRFHGGDGDKYQELVKELLKEKEEKTEDKNEEEAEEKKEKKEKKKKNKK